MLQGSWLNNVGGVELITKK